ncbi:MAG: UdgX family uracil-DNA binding protein [Ideonella sp.]
MAADGLQRITLATETDLAGFRQAARRLIGEGVAPERVSWRIGGAATTADLFEPRPELAVEPDHVDDEAASAAATSLSVPRSFAKLVESVGLHADPSRFALLYGLLWRLQREPALRADPLDPQWMQADRMAHAVRRDQHKMTAFVRFRRIERNPGEAPLHVAWYEPDHHIIEATAPFFARRFAQMQWSILTPQRSVSWDGQALRFADGAARGDAPDADAGESLWLTYYQHIFNPARLKLSMMRKEMPVRYWKNLPEAALIDPLTAAAHQRSSAMIAQQPTETARTIRRLAASKVLMPDVKTPEQLPRYPAAGASTAERHAAFEQTRSAALACTHCPLYQHATQTVFGEGPLDARWMFVGEQPGDQEDLRGRPFVGPAGQLLAKALDEIGVERSQLYLTNAVKHFKFELRGKRRIHKTAAQREAAACLDWLEREIALVRPQAIVALGATAARAVLGRTVAVLRERGRWQHSTDGTPVLVTLHPSALLRTAPEQREQAYADWLADLRLATQAVVLPERSSGPEIPASSRVIDG